MNMIRYIEIWYNMVWDDITWYGMIQPSGHQAARLHFRLSGSRMRKQDYIFSTSILLQQIWAWVSTRGANIMGIQILYILHVNIHTYSYTYYKYWDVYCMCIVSYISFTDNHKQNIPNIGALAVLGTAAYWARDA